MDSRETRGMQWKKPSSGFERKKQKANHELLFCLLQTDAVTVVWHWTECWMYSGVLKRGHYYADVKEWRIHLMSYKEIVFFKVIRNNFKLPFSSRLWSSFPIDSWGEIIIIWQGFSLVCCGSFLRLRLLAVTGRNNLLLGWTHREEIS